MSGNQKSHCAISPAAYAVREAGSGDRYTGRSSLTRARSARIECSHPIRSATTVAGMLGHTCISSRIRGSTSSTIDPGPERTYAGGAADRNADRTVFREHPTTRPIAWIGIPSARCSRRISAQSSTFNTHFLLTSSSKVRLGQGADSPAAKGSVFTCRRHRPAAPATSCTPGPEWPWTSATFRFQR